MTSCIEEKKIEEEIIMLKRIKSIQPGIPQLEKCPVGWKPLNLGKLLKVVSRPVKLEDKMTYRLVTAKRSRGGIVSRSELLGEAIKVKTQFEIKTGDFVISRRQIVHGACGIVPEDLCGSIVSNEYLVLHSNGEVLLEYLNYLSHSIYFQQTCYHSSIGVHVEKMVFKPEIWFKFQFNIPPLGEQQKIVEILNCCDRVIELKDDLLAEKQRQKKYLMQHLLSGELRLKGFDYDWKEVELGYLLNKGFIKAEKGKSLSSSSMMSGTIPVIAGGQKILYSHNNYTHNVDCITISSSGAYAGYVWYHDYSLWASDCSVLYGVNFDTKFLYFVLAANQSEIYKLQAGGAQPHVYISDLKKILIPRPLKEEQKSISDVLSKVDEEIELIKNELNEYKKLKASLMQMLMSGAVRVKI